MASRLAPLLAMVAMVHPAASLVACPASRLRVASVPASLPALRTPRPLPLCLPLVVQSLLSALTPVPLLPLVERVPLLLELLR